MSLDKKGARLEARTHEVLAPYVAWTDRPLWGRVVVISDYHVSDDVREWDVVSSSEVYIPVRFDVVGTMHWATATFFPEPVTRHQRFHVKAIDERWRIVSPHLPPHVGKKRLMNFIRLVELKREEGATRTALRELRMQVETSVGPSPNIGAASP